MPRRKTPKGYDSKFEYDLHKGPLKGVKYHTDKVSYTSEHTYEPDFVYKHYLIEAKGRFRTRDEATKYIWIKRSLVFEELVFIFQNPKTPMPGAVRRKDGTKQSMAEWANKNGLKWYTKDTIKELLC